MEITKENALMVLKRLGEIFLEPETKPQFLLVVNGSVITNPVKDEAELTEVLEGLEDTDADVDVYVLDDAGEEC